MFFSVIVPIYNVEKYLKNCIDSVLNQSYKDFELILVDDGSPDSCPAICDEYKQKDSRIKVIHKENGGLCSARQAGIKLAEGEYIFNLDSDDAIEADTLETAYKIIAETKCDIVSFSYKWVNDSTTVRVSDDGLPEGIYDRSKIEEHIFPKLLMDKNMQHISYYLSGKAVKKELLLPNQLNVSTDISLGEDLCCVFPCYLQANSVYISKKTAYLYTIRNDSLSRDFNAKQIFLVQNVINTLTAFELDKPVDFQEQLCRYSCFMSFAILAAAAEGNHFKSISEIAGNIKSSVHSSLIEKAHFETITFKSRICIFLMKAGRFGTAFYFLNICKNIRKMLGRG